MSPDHRVVKRIFEGIHPTFLRDRKCQVPYVSKPFFGRHFQNMYAVDGRLFYTRILFFVFSSFTFLTVSRMKSIFSPEENVLERTAAGLVSFGEGNLEIRLLLITE